MRKTGLALALIATTQVTLLSTPAFAQGFQGNNQPTATANAEPKKEGEKDEGKIKTGWILVGVGGAVGIAGIVIDIVAANSGTVAGEGGAGDTSTTDNTRTDLYFLGTTLLFAGIATGIYGGSMVWSGNNGADSKTSEPKQQTDEAKTDSVTQAAQARLQSAPSFVLPVIGATF